MDGRMDRKINTVIGIEIENRQMTIRRRHILFLSKPSMRAFAVRYNTPSQISFFPRMLLVKGCKAQPHFGHLSLLPERGL